jgi:hypothetical protein
MENTESMKQIELLPKRAKVKACNWLVRLHPEIKRCNASAVIAIKGAAYCPAHSERAQKLFGQGKPIYA